MKLAPLTIGIVITRPTKVKEAIDSARAQIYNGKINIHTVDNVGSTSIHREGFQHNSRQS
jgi:hypothetical protein